MLTHLTTRKFRFVIGDFCDKQLIAASFADFNLHRIAHASRAPVCARFRRPLFRLPRLWAYALLVIRGKEGRKASPSLSRGSARADYGAEV